MTTREPQLPTAAVRWVAAVVVTGVLALLAAGTTVVLAGTTVEPLTVLVLGGVGVASIVAPLRLHHEGAVQGFNLVIGVFLALTVTASWAVPVLVVALVSLLGFWWSTRSAVKTLFNAGQDATWALLAVSVFHLAGGASVTGDVLAPRSLGIVALTAAVAVAGNVLLTGELFHRLRGRSRRDVLREVLGPVTFVTLGGNAVVAVLLVVLVQRSPVAVLLAAPLFAGLVVGYRGWASEQEAMRRAARLQLTSSMLLEGALDAAALDAAVSGLTELFGAEQVVLDTGDGAEGELAEPLERVRRSGTSLLDTTGGGVLAAPVVLDGVVVGALAVAGRTGLEGWDEGDLALLRTIAGEVAATLRTRELVGELERERAALETETGKLNDILRTASDGIVLLDAHGTVVRCNPAMEQAAGLEPGEGLGRRWDTVLRLQDEEGTELAADVVAPLPRALAGHGGIEGTQVRLLRRDGATRWLRCSAAPVRTEDGTEGVVLVAVDLTHEREVEELRNDFLATVSHELRTPLTPLRGFLSVLREHGATLDAERLGAVHDSMDRQLARLEDLIGDLLTVAELDRDPQPLRLAPTEVGRVVDQVLATEAGGPAAAGRITVDVEPGLVVRADHGALRRIARALVSNALKHTGGQVAITARSAGEHVVLAVDDEGDGIDEQARETIFEPFRRLGNHLHRPQGPGLGLGIARALTEAIDGELVLLDAPGGGCRFELRLHAGGERAPDRRPVGAEHPRR